MAAQCSSVGYRIAVDWSCTAPNCIVVFDGFDAPQTKNTAGDWRKLLLFRPMFSPVVSATAPVNAAEVRHLCNHYIGACYMYTDSTLLPAYRSRTLLSTVVLCRHCCVGCTLHELHKLIKTMYWNFVFPTCTFNMKLDTVARTFTAWLYVNLSAQRRRSLLYKLNNI